MKPRLFLCSGSQLLEADRGFTDAGERFEMRARSRVTLPAGVGGDAIFRAIHLALSFSTPFVLHITPVVDGVPLWDRTARISNTQSLERPFTMTYEVGLYEPVMHGDTEVGRTGLIGTTFALDLWMPCLFERDGDLFIEAAEIEYDVLNAGVSA